MPKQKPELLNYFLEDCLWWDRQFSVKSMFWWYGIYKNLKIFSIFTSDTIYFKVDENNIEQLKLHGSEPFSYEKKNWKVELSSYWELPEEVLEDREELNIWIERSLSVKSKIYKKWKSHKNSELDKKILESLLEIPKWKVSTYKILADKFWVHPRRIASVMRNNKDPDIYPCYKIVSHSWKVSGYSWPDGVNSKNNMLEDNWVKIVDWMIGEESFYWF